MAKVLAKHALDMHVLADLNFGGSGKLEDEAHSSKVLKAFYDSGESDAFLGTFKISQNITGTATQWIHQKDGKLQWSITGIALSAAPVRAAVDTATKSDDTKIVVAMLSKADTITGSKFADRLMGYSGNDTLQGGGGTDTIDGGKGFDRVSFADQTGAVVLTLNGASASNAYINGIKADRIFNVEQAEGGSNGDTLTGDGTKNVLAGNAGKDTVDGGSGDDTILGGADNDSLMGGFGNDQLMGESGKDYLDGGSGGDRLDGGTNGDTLVGGIGNDTLNGGSDAFGDTLSGGAGFDSLDGGKGADSLDGGADADTLLGGSGADILIGGGGRDTMTGGTEADIFRYLDVSDSPAGSTADFILDFVHLVDRIDLSLIDAMASLADDQAFVLDAKGKAPVVAEGHIGWYVVDKPGTASDRTFIRVNIDADATIELGIELKGIVSLSTADFIL